MSNVIHKANSVDILEDDGLFRYGRVVDVADNGLFIDFFCPDRRRELTPRKRIWCSHRSRSIELAFAYRGPHSTIPVEVLLSETPSGPWIWFPADLLNLTRGVIHFRYNVAVVQWWKDGLRYTDIFPPERVRWRASSKWWATIGQPAPAGYLPSYRDYAGNSEYCEAVDRIWPEYAEKWIYVKLCVPLPEDFFPPSAAALDECLSKRAGLGNKWDGVCVEVVDGCLFYVHVARKRTESSSAYLDGLDLRVIRQLPLITVTKNTAPDTTQCFNTMPAALLLEVLSHLDTLKQNELRAVCATWNAIVQSPQLTTTIVIKSYGRDQLENPAPKRLAYLLTVPIFKCLCSTTKRIIVDMRHKKDLLPTEYRILFDVIAFVAQQSTSVALSAIYLVGLNEPFVVGTVRDNFYCPRCALHVPESLQAELYPAFDTYECHIADFIASWRECPCLAIYLVQCTVRLKYFAEKLEIQVPAARLALPDDSGAALWDALDMALPPASNGQLQILSGWFKELEGKKYSRVAFKMISKVLCNLQTVDPRPTLHYRDKEWCIDGLQDLQLHKLSRVSLRFLLLLIDSQWFTDKGLYDFACREAGWENSFLQA